MKDMSQIDLKFDSEQNAFGLTGDFDEFGFKNENLLSKNPFYILYIFILAILFCMFYIPYRGTILMKKLKKHKLVDGVKFFL